MQFSIRSTRLGAAAAVVSLAATLAACGSSTNSAANRNVAFAQLPPCPMDALAAAKKPVDITIWQRKTVQQASALEELAAKFNSSQQQVRVHIETLDSAAQVYEAYKGANHLSGFDPTIAGAWASKPVPAIAILDSTRLREFADSGVVLPAQSCINATKFDNSRIAPALRAYYSIGGVQWAAYMGVAVPGDGFNADQLRKAGIDPAKPPVTLSELEVDAKKIKAAKITDKPIALTIDPMLIETWLTGAGASVVSDGNGRQAPATKATFNSGAAIRLFDLLKRMYNEGLISFSEIDKDQIDHLVAMANGTASITFDKTEVVTSVEAFVEGNKKAQEASRQLNGAQGLGSSTVTTDYRNGPMPGLDRGGQVSIYGNAWYISRQVPAAEQAAAWKFAEFMYREENQAVWLTKGAYLPVFPSTSNRSDVKKFWDSGLAGRWLKVASDELNKLDPRFPGPLIGPYNDFNKIMSQAIRDIRDHPDWSSAKILQTAETDFTEKLQEYNSSHGR